MQQLYLIIGLLTVCGIVMAVFKIASPRRAKEHAKEHEEPIAFPYEKKSTLFTPAERSFLGVLDQAAQGQFRVFGKVRVADIIEVKPGLNGGARLRALNPILEKHVDFVLCHPNDLSVQFVVELDDASHQAPRRKTRDEFLNDALRAAGVPLLHFPVKHGYSVQDVQETISGTGLNSKPK